MICGDRYPLVPHEWGQHTFNRLKQLGVHGKFHIIHNALHEIKEKEIQQMYVWINR
jgi:predicted esterase